MSMQSTIRQTVLEHIYFMAVIDGMFCLYIRAGIDRFESIWQSESNPSLFRFDPPISWSAEVKFYGQTRVCAR